MPIYVNSRKLLYSLFLGGYLLLLKRNSRTVRRIWFLLN